MICDSERRAEAVQNQRQTSLGNGQKTRAQTRPEPALSFKESVK